MLWICLAAAGSLLGYPDSKDGAVTSVSIAQPTGIDAITIGIAQPDNAVVVEAASDAVGNFVDLSRPVSHARPKARPRTWSARMGQPAPGRTSMTSDFGLRLHPVYGAVRFHSGIDLAARPGAPIFSSSEGVVGSAGWSRGYGLLVTLKHTSGLETRYGHLLRLNVAPGQQIRRGDVIGFVGSTGVSTGPHLHYELRLNGVAVDPLQRRRGR